MTFCWYSNIQGLISESDKDRILQGHDEIERQIEASEFGSEIEPSEPDGYNLLGFEIQIDPNRFGSDRIGSDWFIAIFLI